MDQFRGERRTFGQHFEVRGRTSSRKLVPCNAPRCRSRIRAFRTGQCSQVQASPGPLESSHRIGAPGNLQRIKLVDGFFTCKKTSLLFHPTWVDPFNQPEVQFPCVEQHFLGGEGQVAACHGNASQRWWLPGFCAPREIRLDRGAAISWAAFLVFSHPFLEVSKSLPPTLMWIQLATQ